MAESPFSFLPLGAIIQSININGLNIVLGFPHQDQYVEHNTPYFGETIGRVANRIAGARIDFLDGAPRPLAANMGPNCGHGGISGWGKRIWDGPALVEAREIPGLEGLVADKSVAYSRTSLHEEEGFPGTVEAKVTYTTGSQAADGKQAFVLVIDYEASLVGDAEETVISMTNHSYFNLSGDATIEGTTVTLATRNNLPLNSDSIPTGPPVSYPSVDTSQPFVLGAKGPNIDNCFTLADDPSTVPIDTRSQPLVRNISAHHPKTGIHLEVLSTEPCFQFYTGDYIDVPAVQGAPARGPRSGFCCEPSRFVNACNVPDWKAMAIVKRGDTYGSRIVYRIWTD